MDTMQKAKDLLQKMESVKFAYLFGSYARGEQREGSDVDIALYLQDYSFDEKLKVHHALQRSLQKEVDLVVLNSIKNFDLLQDILDEGILLKESADDSRFMFELSKEHEMKDYAVFKKMNDVA